MLDVTAWLDALRDADTPADGFTSRDISQALGVRQARAQEILRQLFAEGKLIHAGFRPTVTIDGRTTRSPLYQLRGATNGRKEEQKDHLVLKGRKEGQEAHKVNIPRKRARRSARG